MVFVKRRLAVAVLLLVGISGLTSSQFEGWPGSQGTGSPGESIDFGDVAVGQTATAGYTFKVLESSQTSVQVTFHDPCSPFGFSRLSSHSMTLAPGQSVRFDVTFTPSEARSYACSFVVRASGGYPVRTTETVVRLSGRGVTGGGAPSESPGSTLPGLPIGLPLVETPPASTPQGIAGTTDDEGRFEVTVPPAATVTGRLTECGGLPLDARPFRIAPVGDGYEIAVPGYEVVAVEPVESISFLGMESVGLGDVCLEPLPEEVAAPPTDLETEESGACPCCSIVVEARMCCRPRGEYIETDTVYAPQSVRIRVAYCEPPEELGDVDLTPLPLTSTGGVLVNPGLAPSDPSMPDPGQIGVTSITLDGEGLFEGAGEFETTVHAGTLEPGSHTVRVTIGRLDGEECVCEKTFEVLACPEVDAKIESALDPENGCAPVEAAYDLDWPGGKDDICRILFWDERGGILEGDLIDGFPLTKTYLALDACTPRLVEPAAYFDANNCCRYDARGEPFEVHPPLRMAGDCVCLRLVPNPDGTIATQVVFQRKVPASGGLPCILCADDIVAIDWGDGESGLHSPSSNDDTGEWTVTHQYDTKPEYEDQRPPVDIHVKVSSDPCGSTEKKLTGKCEFPADLIPQDEIDLFLKLAGGITNPEDIALVVDNLFAVFDKVGETRGETTVCSVLLDMRLKGLDMEYYADFDALVKGFRSGVAGGVFSGKHDGEEEDDESWRFYPSSSPPNGKDYASAKLVYRPGKPGESPYFELTILRGGCDDCPIPPTYRIVSTLTDRAEKRETDETRYGGGDPSSESPSTVSGQTFEVTLSIGLCCPPDLCDE